MVVFGEVHHLLIDIQPINPRRSSTFLFLVPNQRSIKVVRPSSVSPLLVKGKAYALFSWKSVNMVSDVDFISMSRNGQLIGFCHALPKTESRDLIRRSKQTLFHSKLSEDTSATARVERDTENFKEFELWCNPLRNVMSQ